MSKVRIVLTGGFSWWLSLDNSIDDVCNEYIAKLDSLGIPIQNRDSLEYPQQYTDDVMLQNIVEGLPIDIKPIMTFTINEDDLNRSKLINQNTNRILFDDVEHRILSEDGKPTQFSLSLQIHTVYYNEDEV